VIDTYGCTPETVRGLLQVRHRSLADGQKGADFYMARGHITSSPFQLPKGDYVLDLRYQGHRDGAHESVRLLLLDGAQRVYDTGYLPSKGKAIVEEKLTLTVTQDMAEARVHLTGCDVTVHQAALSPPSGGTSVIPNGDFEQAGPSALQVPGWEVGGPRHTWWGRLPAGMNYQGILQFEDRIYTLYSGRRIYVFDATADPVDLLTPGGMVLPVSHDILTFCVRGSLLYAVSTDPSNDPATKPQNNFLQIVDISDLKSPKLLGEYHRDELGMEIGQFMPYPPNGWVGPHYGMAVSKDILVCGERYHYREA
jgi:hypothetical protein